MKHLRCRPRAVSTLVSIIVSACATVQRPIPELSHSRSSALAIEVTLRVPVGFVKATPDRIYFAKIDGNGPGRYQVIPSNYSKEGRAYLLNAQPGSYVAVAALSLRDAKRIITHFSRDLVEQTQVIVRDSEFTFMGSYRIDLSIGLDQEQGAPANWTNARLMGLAGEYHYRGTLFERKNDQQARSEFSRNAREDLAGSPWAARIR
jgi:hypothetical protein